MCFFKVIDETSVFYIIYILKYTHLRKKEIDIDVSARYTSCVATAPGPYIGHFFPSYSYVYCISLYIWKFSDSVVDNVICAYCTDKYNNDDLI